MPISRRGFLGYAAGASAMALGSARQPARLFAQEPTAKPGPRLIDFGRQTILAESAAGYGQALSGLGFEYRRISALPDRPVPNMILPAAPHMGARDTARIRDLVEAGSTVLLESAAAFLRSGEFDSYKRSIKSAFGLSLHAPIRLWDSADSFRQSPYVDYGWPLKMKVRDFSRVVPVDGFGVEEIAWFQQVPVGVKHRMGSGMLVFLGSPMGPHLLAGDRESALWLGRFCSLC